MKALNLRALRAIAALLRGPVSREALDRIAGASNSPQLVLQLRRRGLDIPCKRVRKIDRDGAICWPGIYQFTEADRNRIAEWRERKNPGTLAGETGAYCESTEEHGLNHYTTGGAHGAATG